MFIDSFIGYLRSERNYSQHTLRAYARDLRAFEEFMSRIDESLSFSDADTDVVRMWVTELMDAGAATSSVCRKMSSLRAMYDYMRAEGLVDANPLSGLKAPKRRKHLPAFVKESEMDALLDDTAFGEGYEACRDRMILLCFYSTGMRLSELVGLDVRDVDLRSGVVKVLGKRARERVIPFGEELRREFGRYLEERAAFAGSTDGALFLSGKGGRVSRSYIYRMVNGRLSGVTSLKKKSPHVLRHTFATSMLNNDAELGAVKELLGHKKLATTEIYTHLTFEELKRYYEKAHPRAGNI